MEPTWHSVSENSSTKMDTNSEHEYIPTWKMPISKSFSTSLFAGDKTSSESSSGIGGERDSSSVSEPEFCPVDALHKKLVGGRQEEEDFQLIQILLPCLTCNRTFSPEALERHSKVCTKVNAKTPYKPERGKFDTAEQRKKGTKAEYFIPPPDPEIISPFSRGSILRRSLRGTSCTSGTRPSLNSESLSLHQIGLGPSPLRRQRSVSQHRGDRGHSKTPSEYLYDDHSEFGSNSEESQNDPNLPSYAKPLAPTDECPFCNRCFGPKAYDRHVQYCKEKCVQRQYEIQPVPKDKIEAFERQEIRTKYRPIKGSSSCSHLPLRSVSPGKDFAAMTYKLFGLRRSDVAGNLYNNQIGNFKKSNESLSNSCYGDYTRGMRRPSPSPSNHSNQGSLSMANKINNLFSKTFHYPSQVKPANTSNANNILQPITRSNIPKLARSSDNLSSSMGMSGSNQRNTTTPPYVHVSSSGYGQQATSNFNRSSKSRSSLHKNFLRPKRTEPEGTENTDALGNNHLIITPMTFYSKGGENRFGLLDHSKELYRPKGTTLLSQDPNYDPYEVAAKQLEELLNAQPINKNVNKKTARKLGLEKAFESVGVHHSTSETTSDDNKLRLRKSNENSFVFDEGKMNDNYWDDVLQKSSNSAGKREGKMLESKSQQSPISTVDKSGAFSKISSADSGFSRSEVNDAEFEALESIVGEMPQQMKSFKRTNPPFSSFHPTFTNNTTSRTENEPQSPMQISPTRKDSEDSSPNGMGARFCHECGNLYPSQVAKFCSECGEKRVFRF